MFNKNLKIFRKKKGYTQEELANSLNVVRQTISKWEQGLSVPDAEMLIRLADLLDVSVSQLIGATVEDETNENNIAQILSKINEQLAQKNHRAKRTCKFIVIVVGVILICWVFLMLINCSSM